jgi:hypothetical protein
MQDLVGLFLGVRRPGQARVQAFDGHCHRPGAPLRPVLAQPRILAEVLSYAYSAQGILASIRMTGISDCMVRFHNSCHPYGRKKNLPVTGSAGFR